MFRKGSVKKPFSNNTQERRRRGRNTSGALQTAVEAQNEGGAQGNLTNWATRRTTAAEPNPPKLRQVSPRPTRRSPRLAAQPPQQSPQRSPSRRSVQRSPQRSSPRRSVHRSPQNSPSRRSPARRAKSPKKGVSPTRSQSSSTRDSKTKGMWNAENPKTGLMRMLPNMGQPFKRFYRHRNKKAGISRATQTEEQSDLVPQSSEQSEAQGSPKFAAADFMTATPNPARLPIPKALQSQTNSLGTHAIQGSSSTENKPVEESPIEFLFEAARNSKRIESKSSSFDEVRSHKAALLSSGYSGRRRRHTVGLLDEKTRLLSLELGMEQETKTPSMDGDAMNDGNEPEIQEYFQASESHSLPHRGRGQ